MDCASGFDHWEFLVAGPWTGTHWREQEVRGRLLPLLIAPAGLFCADLTSYNWVLVSPLIFLFGVFITSSLTRPVPQAVRIRVEDISAKRD